VGDGIEMLAFFVEHHAQRRGRRRLATQCHVLRQQRVAPHRLLLDRVGDAHKLGKRSRLGVGRVFEWRLAHCPSWI
jgi:hypothetical protein